MIALESDDWKLYTNQMDIYSKFLDRNLLILSNNEHFRLLYEIYV